MKVAEADLLLLPGWTTPSDDLWLSRWSRQLSSARLVEQTDWETPRIDDWTAAIVQAVARATRPVVLIAHSCGVSAVAHAGSQLPAGSVHGALLVAPPDLAAHDIWPATHGGFHPVPRDPLPFPSLVLYSENDPYCSVDRAQAFASDWGARSKSVGALGHINTASGQGPWPEGTLALAHFMKSLPTRH